MSEVACFVLDHADRVGVTLRYGLGTQRRAWELPTGEVLDGEDVLAAAHRIVQDACGWTIHSPQVDTTLARWPGRSDATTQVVVARAHHQVGPFTDDLDDFDWFERVVVRGALTARHLHDAVTAYLLFRWLDAGGSR